MQQQHTTHKPDGMSYTLTFSEAKQRPPPELDFKLRDLDSPVKDMFWQDMQWRINAALANQSRYKLTERARREQGKVDAAKWRREHQTRRDIKIDGPPAGESSNIVPPASGINSRDWNFS